MGAAHGTAKAKWQPAAAIAKKNNTAKKKTSNIRT